MLEHADFLPDGVGTFWTDNGSEFQNSDMDAFCNELCIKRAFTIPYCSPQNPYAERAWSTVLRKVRTSLVANNLDESYWSYAIKQAALIHNILVDDDFLSPYEKVHGQPYEYTKLHSFGCLCYFLLPVRDRPSKLSPTALPAIYLGVDPDRQGHLVHVPGLQRFTSSYHCIFNENKVSGHYIYCTLVSYCTP
jgi:transposase InsO family protein